MSDSSCRQRRCAPPGANSWGGIMVLVGTLTCAGWAQERGYDFPPPRGEGFGPGLGPARPPAELDPQPIESGYLFLDGAYLPPPYQVECTDEAVLVNGRELTCDLSEPEGGGRGFGSWRGLSVGRAAALTLQAELRTGSVVLSFAGQPKVLLDGGGSAYALFKILTTRGDDFRRVSLVERLRPGFDLDAWNAWLDRYEAPPELRSRAANLINSFETSERRALAEIAATKRLNDWAYPLSMLGFGLIVLAMGHLLGGRPHAGQSAHGQDFSPQVIGAMNWTLALIALMSTLDMVWTILVAQAGQMREMNPIGSHLTENPRQLIGFKVGATFPSVALLWLLRSHKRAQIAAWWICLILVILAFRWMTVNSAWMAA